mmetsp:Transcript_15758/g.32332  ORF Transcript_15758/g.32332 Transcript_15758/m.32332 type:complete len:237 (-) Transcript_15758:1251-1961(-)
MSRQDDVARAHGLNSGRARTPFLGAGGSCLYHSTPQHTLFAFLFALAFTFLFLLCFLASPSFLGTAFRLLFVYSLIPVQCARGRSVAQELCIFQHHGTTLLHHQLLKHFHNLFSSLNVSSVDQHVHSVAQQSASREHVTIPHEVNEKLVVCNDVHGKLLFFLVSPLAHLSQQPPLFWRLHFSQAVRDLHESNVDVVVWSDTQGVSRHGCLHHHRPCGTVRGIGCRPLLQSRSLPLD